LEGNADVKGVTGHGVNGIEADERGEKSWAVVIETMLHLN
jgi:hypothetical protein